MHIYIDIYICKWINRNIHVKLYYLLVHRFKKCHIIHRDRRKGLWLRTIKIITNAKNRINARLCKRGKKITNRRLRELYFTDKENEMYPIKKKKKRKKRYHHNCLNKFDRSLWIHSVQLVMKTIGLTNWRKSFSSSFWKIVIYKF